MLRMAQKACGAAIDAIDFELGGELAASNAALYQFWYRELVAANIEGDVKRARGSSPRCSSFATRGPKRSGAIRKNSPVRSRVKTSPWYDSPGVRADRCART